MEGDSLLQNVTVIKPRSVQQKLLNISKVDGQASSDCPSCETAEQTAARLTAGRCGSQLCRNAETPEQSAARRLTTQRSSQRDCRQRQQQQLYH